MQELKAQIWVGALVRRAHAAGAFAAIVARGDADFGVVLVKVNLLDGRARLYAPSIDGEGGRVWMDPLGREAPAPEADADAYIARRRVQDPDIWVVEVEDRAGRTFIV